LNASTTSRYLYAGSTSSPHTTEVFPDGFPAGLVPNFKMEYTPVKTNIGTGAWRAPGHNATAFVDQSFVDEMAHLAGRDPVDFRLEILGPDDKIMPYRDHGGPEYSTARLKGAIQLAVEKSDWYGPKEEGIYKGFACHFMFGAYVAEVVVLSLKGGRVKIEKVICALDCGLVVNPSGAINQVQGGIIDGLQTALSTAIHIEAGNSKEKNFDAYRMLCMKDIPDIEVYFVASEEDPEGLGEMSLPAVSAALCNAIFAATGKRIRSLPFDLAKLV
jgi:CO/xanthine dehydrogenase Mo-binding subunit